MLPQVDWNSPREMGRNPPFFPVGTQWETCGKTQRYTLKTKTSPQKKVLSLVLCVAMLLSVMVMGTGAAFTDEDDFSPQYAEAAEVLTGMKVMQGYDDGSFLPQRNITRAQVATLIYRAVTGDVNDTQTGLYTDWDKFDDVQADDWFAGYVNYCANGELIKGFTPDTFGPNKNVTGYQVLAMILRAVGYDQNDEFTGSGWEIRTASIAESLGILDNVQDATLGQPATRELVAELIFQAMIVPTVEYTVAFGYQPVWPRETLGEREFGLEQISGEISAVGRTAGTTEFNDKTVVAKTDTAWTDIGYGAYVWTVPTSGSKALTAVSDVSITGESLLTTTDGTSVADADVTIENDAHLYYNGDYVGQIKVNANGDVTNVDGMDVDSNLVDKAPLTGVKVDYIDNDNGGRAEAVVVTEYTTAQITGIATDSTSSGTSATEPSTVYFTDYANGNPAGNAGVHPVAADYAVSDANLAVGNIVTYVAYDGLDTKDSYYTFVASGVTDTLNKVVRENIHSNPVEHYIVGDADLYKSEITGMDTSVLSKAYLGEDVTYYLDEYGYVILATLYSEPTQYLFGISNNHTDGNTDVATGKVVFTDGAVSNVSIAFADDEDDLGNNVIKDKLYTYTTNSDNEYTLTTSPEKITSAVHEDDNVNITLNGTKYYVDNQTIVVDVTDVRDNGATSATVYTGTANIPAFDYADGYFVADADNYVSLMFVYDYGTYASDRFMVYDISDSTVTYDKDGNIYTLDVVRDGVPATVDLTEEQFLDIVKYYGVGIYTTDEPFQHITGYTSYAEVYGSLTWNDNTIRVNANGDWNAYSYNENTTITVLNITTGEAKFFTGLEAGMTFPWVDNSSDNARGFVDVDADGNVAEHIYFVVGNEATAKDNHHVVTEPALANGSVTEYYVKDGMVTGVNVGEPKYHDVIVDDATWQTVLQGTEISVPDQGKGGTGAKVTIGDNDPVYMEYGESISVTGEVIIETGYVAWTIGDTTIPVQYSTSGQDLDSVLGDLKGTYVHFERTGASNYASGYQAVTGTLQSTHDTTFEDGFYKVDASNVGEGFSVVVNGTPVSDDVFYVKTDAVINVVRNGDSEIVTSYGADGDITADITIADPTT